MIYLSYIIYFPIKEMIKKMCVVNIYILKAKNYTWKIQAEC